MSPKPSSHMQDVPLNPVEWESRPKHVHFEDIMIPSDPDYSNDNASPATSLIDSELLSSQEDSPPKKKPVASSKKLAGKLKQQPDLVKELACEKLKQSTSIYYYIILDTDGCSHLILHPASKCSGPGTCHIPPHPDWPTHHYYTTRKLLNNWLRQSATLIPPHCPLPPFQGCQRPPLCSG